MAPKRNIFGQIRARHNGKRGVAGSPGAWVSKSVNMSKENIAETVGNKGAENRSGDIAEERCITKHVGVNAKVRRKLERLDLRTGSLLLSKVKRRKGRSNRE